jgi:hypothetical protein
MLSVVIIGSSRFQCNHRARRSHDGDNGAPSDPMAEMTKLNHIRSSAPDHWVFQ